MGIRRGQHHILPSEVNVSTTTTPPSFTLLHNIHPALPGWVIEQMARNPLRTPTGAPEFGLDEQQLNALLSEFFTRTHAEGSLVSFLTEAEPNISMLEECLGDHLHTYREAREGLRNWYLRLPPAERAGVDELRVLKATEPEKLADRVVPQRLTEAWDAAESVVRVLDLLKAAVLFSRVRG